MSLIRFTRDFRGRASNEQYYQEGEVVDCPTAALIVAEGAAVFVDPTASDFVEAMVIRLESNTAEPIVAVEETPVKVDPLADPMFGAENRAIHERELAKLKEAEATEATLAEKPKKPKGRK